MTTPRLGRVAPVVEIPQHRRRFDHFIVELSVTLGRLAPRYPLWLRLQEHGEDPATLSWDALHAFIELDLEETLAEHGLALSDRMQRKLIRRLRHFDPTQPTPYETMERLFSPHR